MDSYYKNYNAYAEKQDHFHPAVTVAIILGGILACIVIFYIIGLWICYEESIMKFLSLSNFTMRAHRHSELGEPRLTTSSQINSGEPATTGLDPSVISSLPVIKFRKEEFLHLYKGDMAMECVVCLSILEYETLVRVLTNCNHFFHVCCIDKWLSSHPTCPICRAEAMPRVIALDHVVVIDSEEALSDGSPQSDGSLQSPIQVNGLESSTSPIRRVENIHQEKGNGSFDSVLKS